MRAESRLRIGQRHFAPCDVRCQAHRRLAGLEDIDAADLGLIKASIPARQVASNPGEGDPYAGNPNLRRNDPCPCGSGQKYKHCHGAY